MAHNQFISNLIAEGYKIIFDCEDEGTKYYRCITPEGRTFTGTIEEIEDFVGE